MKRNVQVYCMGIRVAQNFLPSTPLSPARQIYVQTYESAGNVVPVQAMQAYGGVEARCRSFIHSQPRHFRYFQLCCRRNVRFVRSRSRVVE